jgi:L-iditol 2-dehydrogenase
LLGHEPSGVVDAVGSGADLKVGLRVAVEPGHSCGKCEHCRSGRYNICPQVKFLGTPPIDGIFAQYHVMPAECCIPIPDQLTLRDAALLEPLGVGLHAVKLAQVTLGETVAIFGSGPIGLVTMLAARLAGAGQVFMTDLVPERLKLAGKLGADATLDASQQDPVEWIRKLTGGRGVDVAFEAAGEQATLTQSCLATRIGGGVAVIGIPAVDEFAIPMHEIRRRELTIYNCRRSNHEVEQCLSLVVSGRLNLQPLATHFFPLEKAGDAMELVHRRAEGGIRAIITPNPDLAIV